MSESQQLLAQYAREGAEEAFRELVARYIDLVYSTALRLVDGDTHLAEDVAQTVFLHLARSAGRLGNEPQLGGWLHRDTCYVSSKLVRGKGRRQAREREAAFMESLQDHTEANLAEVAPILDEAINRLGKEDRAAIRLRFFEQKDYRALGALLGSSENGARMRVNRALEKLQGLLKRKGASLSAVALGTALAHNAVAAAPAGLAGSVAGAVLASSSAGSGVMAMALKMALTTKGKMGAVGAVVMASVATTWVFDYQERANAGALERALGQGAEQLDQWQRETERLSNTLYAANRVGMNEADELGRLREEAAALRKQTDGLGALRKENQRLKESLSSARFKPDGIMSQPPGLLDEGHAKVRYGMQLGLAILQYASDHGEQMPANFAQAATYVSAETKGATNFSADRFEIVYQGSRDALTNYAHQGDILLIREKRPWKTAGGQWAKVYVYCDGGACVLSAAEGDFQGWERQHTLTHKESRK